MQKLKHNVIDRMMSAHLTKAEVDFMLEISHFQNDAGKVYGVYYKDVCNAINISFQTFYVTMLSLVEKGLIRLSKANYGDWDIIINDNDFSYPGALKEGYISTGHDLFYDDDFRGLKAGEKVLALQFLKIAGAGKKYRIRVELFFQKYAHVLGVTKRTIQTYLSKLRKFFKISVKNKMYWIVPKETCFKYNAPSDIKNFAKHLGNVACRRNRANYTEKEFVDTINLIKQYISQFGSKTGEIFLRAVKESIILSNEHLSDKRCCRQLNPSFIHKLMIRK